MREEDLQRIYEHNLPLLVTLATNLHDEIREVVKTLPFIDRVTCRAKTADSFVAKAVDPANDPPYGNPLVEIEDQVGARVLVFFRSSIDKVTERLVEATFTPVEISRRQPKRDEEFGYESDHLICNIPPHLLPAGWSNSDDNLPKTIELQVRTLFMHAYAEPQHDISYKGPRDLPAEIRRELAWIAASSWGADQAYLRLLEWWEESNN